MNQAYLLIGGNLGEKRRNLENTVALIGKNAGTVLRISPFYETQAWGKTNQPPFLNQALMIETAWAPLPLLEVLLEIEQQMGRLRDEKYGPRSIDIDILFYNNVVLQTEKLTIPHPQLPFRRFVLTPLNDIAPHFIHPQLGKTIAEILSACEDTLEVVAVTG